MCSWKALEQSVNVSFAEHCEAYETETWQIEFCVFVRLWHHISYLPALIFNDLRNLRNAVFKSLLH